MLTKLFIVIYKKWNGPNMTSRRNFNQSLCPNYSVCLFGNKVVVYGGYKSCLARTSFFNGCLELITIEKNMNSLSFIFEPNLLDTQTCGYRNSHTGNVYQNRLYLLGGLIDESNFNAGLQVLDLGFLSK